MTTCASWPGHSGIFTTNAGPGEQNCTSHAALVEDCRLAGSRHVFVHAQGECFEATTQLADSTAHSGISFSLGFEV